MSKKIIVIGREFGSGGRELGERLATELNISFYDKELVTQVSQQMEINEGSAVNLDEQALSDMAAAYLSRRNCARQTRQNTFLPGDSELLTDKMYLQQKDLILKIIGMGPCVIVGRCADYILRDHEDVLSVFIHADKASRIQRVEKRSGMSYHEAKTAVKEVDKQRESYYEQHTGQKWGHAENYHILLNTSRLDMEDAIRILKSLCMN